MIALTTATCDSQAVLDVFHGPRKAVTRVNGVNMRIAPFIQASKVEVLRKDLELRLLGTSAEKDRIGSSSDFWYHVELENGVRGWIYGTGLIKGEESLAKKARRPGVVHPVSELLPDLDLVGVWKIRSGAMNRQKSRRYSLTFRSEGTLSFDNGVDSPVETGYEIDHRHGLVRFKSKTELGDSLHYSFSGKELLLTGELNQSPVLFHKSRKLRTIRNRIYIDRTRQKEEPAGRQAPEESETGNGSDQSDQIEDDEE